MDYLRGARPIVKPPRPETRHGGIVFAYRYANGVRLIYRTERPYIRFEGSEGWIEAEFGKELDAHPRSVLDSRIGPDETHLPLRNEKRDFIDCVKNRGRTLDDAEVGHRTASLCHLGHIAAQVGAKLRWDPAAERFTNSDEANKTLTLPSGREWWSHSAFRGEHPLERRRMPSGTAPRA